MPDPVTPAHSAHFEATGSDMMLTQAILLYRTGTSGALRASGQEAMAFASIHGIEHDDEGSPTIRAGRPLTRAHLRQWAEALGRRTVPEILPANVLVAHPDLLAWWVPEQVRDACFALSSPPAGLRCLSGRTIVPVPYPAHLFVATRSGLGVYALPKNERPTADTRVLHSPILNVFLSGMLCWGNIPRPKTLAIAAIPDFERAVFDSWSTHPNPGQELTISGKGGLVRLWDVLAARRATRFPVRRMKPFATGSRQQSRRDPAPGAARPVTAGQLIAANARR
ncbi:PRTRC system protein B [Novosphingobium album (ex Liu et al. 2023)]|uniref:PRTRC system protein B n=1 Tax=Novosphingobium album (ex Liu et al. 2023) TaxID=3031130 RepID=A0ABT5WQ61_9SPHN|nr:PRTRC system protein B [Novosphingobium album (ex Liu et al. 2023)]MDE8652155.1 PRTRC system protein B [Novosphingobium album (ex Liu et al. 2023)]